MITGASPRGATKEAPETYELRELRPEDLETIRTWLDDEGIRSFAGGDGALAFVEDVSCDALTLTDASGEVVGFATLEPCLGGQSPMVLMAVDPGRRGRGLGTRLYEELAAWGREHTEFGAVYGEISPDNVASRRAAEKAGWVLIDTDEDGYQTFCSMPDAGPSWP